MKMGLNCVIKLQSGLTVAFHARILTQIIHFFLLINTSDYKDILYKSAKLWIEHKIDNRSRYQGDIYDAGIWC